MPSRAKSKGLQALVDEFIGDDPERTASFEKACDDLEIGVELNRLRTEAGLSTRALAQRVGTQASVISRIERAVTSIESELESTIELTSPLGFTLNSS